MDCKFKIGDYVYLGSIMKGIVTKTTYCDFSNRIKTEWNWIIDVDPYYFFSEREGKVIDVGTMTHLEKDLQLDIKANRDKNINKILNEKGNTN